MSIWKALFNKITWLLENIQKKSEFVSKCWHCNKYLIKNVTKNDSMGWCSALYVFKLHNKFTIFC